MAFWLVVGPPDNWQYSFDHGNIWGFPQHYEPKWTQMQAGDTLIFYATRPVKGLIGYGILESKMPGEQPFFSSETDQRRVLWPLRIRYRSILSLPSEKWQTSTVPLERRGVIIQRALHRLRGERGQELIETLSSLQH